jgi:hypothetical protein
MLIIGHSRCRQMILPGTGQLVRRCYNAPQSCAAAAVASFDFALAHGRNGLAFAFLEL